MTLKVHTRKDAVLGAVAFAEGKREWYDCQHVQLIGRRLTSTFRARDGAFNESKGVIDGDRMQLELWRRENSPGKFTFIREN
jgi:hypothetical protein